MSESKHRRRGGSRTLPKGASKQDIDDAGRRAPRQPDATLWPDDELARMFDELEQKYADDPRAEALLGLISKIRDPRGVKRHTAPPWVILNHPRPLFGYAEADPGALLLGMRLQLEILSVVEPGLYKKVKDRNRGLAALAAAVPPIDEALRERVKHRVQELMPTADSKTACYRQVANEFDEKHDRVRYIVEGPRRSKT